MKLSNKKLLSALALAGLTAAGPAFAGKSYIGLAFGQSQYEELDAGQINAAFASIGLGAITSVDDKGSPFKFFTGYRYSENLAFEGGYTWLGDVESRSTIVSGGSGTAIGTWEGSSATFAVLGIAPINESASFFGKLGLGFWTASLDVAISGPGGSAVISESDSGISPVVGLGAIFRLTPTFSLRAEWESHLSVGESDTTGDSDVSLLTLGVQLEF